MDSWRDTLIDVILEQGGEFSADSLHEGADGEQELEEALGAADQLVADGLLSESNGVWTVAPGRLEDLQRARSASSSGRRPVDSPLIRGEDYSIMDKVTIVKNLLASSRRLAEMDPQDEAVARTVAEMDEQTKLLRDLASKDKSSPWGAQSMKDDIDSIGDQIKRLKAAAAIPAANYRRMFDILASMERVWSVAARPQNAAVRPKVAGMMRKIAGVFAEVDTVQDLDKPLAAIEAAVHSLYGDQNSAKTYMFDARGKGHHKAE